MPLVLAQGAGAEMRQSLGTAVFFGMLGVTFFGLLLTPVFYVVIRGFASDTIKEKPPGKAALPLGAAPSLKPRAGNGSSGRI